LSLKTVQIATIDKKNSVGVGGVQNRQSGCHRGMPTFRLFWPIENLCRIYVEGAKLDSSLLNFEP
jgi:hypothetical protein